jgi:transposase InsO family protein
MSRKGNPYDNALAESLRGYAESRMRFGGSIPPTKAAATLMIFDYIEPITPSADTARWIISPCVQEHWLYTQRGCSGGGGGNNQSNHPRLTTHPNN